SIGWPKRWSMSGTGSNCRSASRRWRRNRPRSQPNLGPKTSASFRRFGRIGEHSIEVWPGALSQTCRHDLARPKDVKDLLAGGEQVVRNDTAVTPPPHRLGTHHGAAPDAAEFL